MHDHSKTCLEASQEAFELRPYVMLNGFLSRRIAERIYRETRQATERRVICGKPDISWSERKISEMSRIGVFARGRACLRRISSATPIVRSDIKALTIWTSEYRTAEYINPHCDGIGDLQLLFCVQGCASANGGALHVRYKEHASVFQLTTGDAIVFKATEVKHWTTPLVGTAEVPAPERIVLAVRFFFHDRGR
jgi:hypothetical protein